MNTRRTLLAFGIAVVHIMQSQAGQVLFQSGFEAPDYVAGQSIVGQNGWIQYWNQDSNSSIITNQVAASGTQSFKIDGSLMTGGPYGYGNFYYPYLGFEPIANNLPMIDISVDARIDLGSIHANSVLGLEVYNILGMLVAKIELFSIFNDSPPRMGLIVESSNNYQDFEISSSNFGQFMNLALTLDYATQKMDYYLNHQWIASANMQVSPSFGLGECDLTMHTESDTVGYFDNYSVIAVPEPAAFISTGLGLLMICVYSLRKGQSTAPWAFENAWYDESSYFEAF